jgi:hypothetical protein
VKMEKEEVIRVVVDCKKMCAVLGALATIG